MNIVDLFSGAGGLTFGFSIRVGTARFTILAATTKKPTSN